MNNYPKLTAEIWDYKYMPEEARFAAVDRNGRLWAYKDEPHKGTIAWINRGDGWRLGYADPADWENSLIKRPEPQAQAEVAPKVPAWCAVDKWVYWKGAPDAGFEAGFLQITDVSPTGLCICASGGLNGVPIDQLKPAHIRPYTFEEAPEIIKAVYHSIDDRHPFTCLDVLQLVFRGIFGEDEWGYVSSVDNDDGVHSAKFVASGYTFLDGQPCGVLELGEE